MAGRCRPLVLLLVVLAAGVPASRHGLPSRSRVLPNKGPFTPSSPSDLDLGSFVLLFSLICKSLLGFRACSAWPSPGVRLPCVVVTVGTAVVMAAADVAAGTGAFVVAVAVVSAVPAPVLAVCATGGCSPFELQVAACCLRPPMFNTPSRQAVCKAGTQTSNDKQASEAGSFGHLKLIVWHTVGWQLPLLRFLRHVLSIHGSCSRNFHLLFHSFLDRGISGKLGSGHVVLPAHLALSWRCCPLPSSAMPFVRIRDGGWLPQFESGVAPYKSTTQLSTSDAKSDSIARGVVGDISIGSRRRGLRMLALRFFVCANGRHCAPSVRAPAAGTCGFIFLVFRLDLIKAVSLYLSCLLQNLERHCNVGFIPSNPVLESF